MAKVLKRVNIYTSPVLHEFYMKLAEEMGISMSAAMNVALKTYMDQQKALSFSVGMEQMKNLLSQLPVSNGQALEGGE